MADYIKREDVLSLKHRLHNRSKDTIELYPVYVISPDAVEKIPSADIAEVRHSTWLAKDFHTVYCEECKFEIDLMKILYTGLMQHLFYCPNCGADMRKDGE